MARINRPARAVIALSLAVSEHARAKPLVVTIQQVADAPLADRDAAAGQLGVDLRDAALLGVTEPADQRDPHHAALELHRADLNRQPVAIGG